MLNFVGKMLSHPMNCFYCMAESQAIVTRELFRLAIVGLDPVALHVSMQSDHKTIHEKLCSGYTGKAC